jgi:hypothetical protein
MVREKAFDVSGLQRQLAEHPEVWNTIRMRTEHPCSPHRQVSDIWVRYNALENYHGNMQDFNDVHVSEWYPVAEVLTEARRLAECVADGRDIGAVLITKIPAGKQVYPHVDVGWHARTFEKYGLQIHGNERQAFHFEGEDLVTRDGDLFFFDNAYPHWVSNDSTSDRVTMIVCTKQNGHMAGGY